MNVWDLITLLKHQFDSSPMYTSDGAIRVYTSTKKVEMIAREQRTGGNRQASATGAGGGAVTIEQGARGAVHVRAQAGTADRP